MSVTETYDYGTDKLLVELVDGIARITFNNPAKRNAMSTDMRAALPQVLQALQDDVRVRVVVVTGAGNEAFVSGADITEFEDRRTSPEARAEYDRAAAEVGRAWRQLEKPVIAMIRGYCLGGGLITALQADIRIASEESSFGIPAARLGLGYRVEGVQILMDAVGAAWTSEILFSARRLSAAEALHAGLVNRVVPADRLEPDVMELARRIEGNAPLTVAACKVAIRETRREYAAGDVERVAQLVEACYRSADYAEGRRAFAEKRPPRFVGR